MSSLQPKRTMALTALLVLSMLVIAPAQAATAVAEPFQEYYAQHQGLRVLGPPISDLVEVQGFPAQYFEKGRIEDHRSMEQNPTWRFMYGRLTADLIERAPFQAVSGTTMTYRTLGAAAAAENRQPPPNSNAGVTVLPAAGAVFVPFDSQLRSAPGYLVPFDFWDYMNRRDYFPGGWLHDIGLPMTNPLQVTTYKNGRLREITLQAFERAVLTDDPLNPTNWRIERGNIGSDAVRALPMPQYGPMESPALNARVTLPIHLLVRVGEPGQQVTARLRWADGTELKQTYTLLRGEDGRGLLIDNLDWVNMLAPPNPATQAVMLTITGANGRVLVQRQITVVSPNDQATQTIKLFWTVSGAEMVTPQQRVVPKTERIGTAALEELLWGPPAISQVGFRTALPMPQEVLAYAGRDVSWGPRVTLRKLTIVNGVATADFSKELRAYGGGSARVRLIREQITQTLTQFPSVREVRIAIEGQTEGVLEP